MSFTLKDIIDGVIVREGGSKVTNDPVDAGGRTQFGIAEKFHPEAWADGKVTEEEARDIYMRKYVIGPGFDKLPQWLVPFMVDFGVNSGPTVAIEKLQEVLKVHIDGDIGPETLNAIKNAGPNALMNQMVAARVKLLARIVARKPTQARFIVGWVNRAFEFLIP
jgi:lysozyme family protein